MKKPAPDSFFPLFIHFCDTGVRKGWHESGTGGLSMLLYPDLVLDIEAGLDFSRPFQPLGVTVPELAKDFLIVSGNEQFLDDILDRPDEICGIIQVSPDGTGYRKVLGFLSDQRPNNDDSERQPTRDLAHHLLIHAQRLRAGKGRKSVVYHCHPANLTALTYMLPLKDEIFSRILAQSSVRFPEVLPDGIGVIDRLIRDPVQLGAETARKFERHDAVVLAFHGLICAGVSLPDVFGVVEVLEKAADIRLRLLQMPNGTRQEPEL